MSTQSETNPYVSPANPYVTPVYSRIRRDDMVAASGTLVPAACAMIAVAGIGLIFSLISFALSFGEAQIDPAAPEAVRNFQQGTVGPLATAMQGGFAMLNLFIIACGVQMIKLKSWGMAVAGSVLSMLNFGSCCCALGIPVGIWSLCILMSPDVISLFSTANMEQ
jgi:hypothetical protein